MGPGARAEIVLDGLRFPEGLFWSALDERMYFVEWGGDTVLALEGSRAGAVWEAPPGSGPCGLAQAPDGSLWVTLYSAGKVIRLGRDGAIEQEIAGWQGERFRGPNQLATDSQSGLYFTDSGNFADDWETGRPAGSIFYLPPGGDLRRVDSGICFANGITWLVPDRTLIANEHRRNRLLAYDVLPGGDLSARRVFAALDGACLLDPAEAFQLGPDGSCADREGNIWIAHYGGGKIAGFSPAGQAAGSVRLPAGRRPTNIAQDPRDGAFYVTESELGLLYRIR